MSNRELEKLLKRARVPEREAAYWEEFPAQVKRELNRPDQPGSPRFGAHSTAEEEGRPVKVALAYWGAGLAAACIVAALFIGLWKGPKPGEEMQLAEMQKYYREVEALFPHQLQAVIFDQRGPHLALADAPGLPTSDPIFLRICQRRGCQKFITFSGQQIDVNGEKCDVLADAKGNVIITGQKLAWSSADRTRRNSSYQIQAHLLEGAL